jgi:sigma-B regulation protein RsbU (phosphoserine phosphatase)
MASAPAPEPATQQIGCMEIWGGNAAFANALSVAGLDAWVHSEPFEGSAQGGDIHYISTCGHGHIARFVVADVSGHGAEVGAVATKLRRLMRRNMNKLDQTRFVRALNHGFSALNESGLFATAVLTSYYAPTRDLLICNAGHPRPLWYCAATGDWEFLDADRHGHCPTDGNLPIGIIDPTDYAQFAIKLDRDDIVVIYSDWLTEAQAPDGRMLEEDGLLSMARELDATKPSGLAREILDRVAAFRGQAPAGDDVTLIVLHQNGAGPPKFTTRDWIRSAGKMLGLLKV